MLFHSREQSCRRAAAILLLAAAQPAPAIDEAAEQTIAAAPSPAAISRAGPELPKVLDLARAQEIALSGHPSIANAEARMRQAEARFRIVRATFLPSIGVRGSWSKTELPDRLFESSLPSPSEARESFDAATGSWQPGESIDNYLDSSLPDAGDAWRDGELGQFLLDPGNAPSSPIIPEDDLRKLQNYLQSRDALTAEDAEAVADSLRASYLDATVGDTPSTYWAGARASWMVFGGFSRKFRRAAAIHGEQQTLAARRDAERLLLGGVAAAYFQAQYAREEMVIAQNDLDFSERLLKDATRGKEAGTKSADDVLDFGVRRNSAEATLLETQRKYQLSISALAAVMALPEDGIPDSLELAPLITELDPDAKPPNVEDEITYALANRPDLAASRFGVAAKREQKGLSRSTFYPQVWLAGGYDGWREEDIDFEESDFGWNVSMVVSLDLFRGGARLAAVSERVAAQAAAESDVFKNELDAIKEVRDAVSTLVSSGDQYRLQVKNEALVERFRDLVEMEYKAGTAPALKLHDAQRKLVSAQRRHASSLVALHAAWHSLQQATARSLAHAEKESNDHP